METKVERRLLTMTVVRVDPSPINPNGIAIDAVISTQQVTNQVP
jgi:intracellular multiplication protein IcmL